MQTLILNPKTRRAKSKVFEAASVVNLDWDQRTWLVLQTRMALPMTAKAGPWHLVEPLVPDGAPERLSRWVHTADDPDFEVELTACND